MLCSFLGFTKQAYYQQQRYVRKEVEQDLSIRCIVTDIRQGMPTIGGKKLWKMLNRMHIPIGRDKLYPLAELI